MINNACGLIQSVCFNRFLQVDTEKLNKEQNRFLENCMLFDVMRQKIPDNKLAEDMKKEKVKIRGKKVLCAKKLLRLTKANKVLPQNYLLRWYLNHSSKIQNTNSYYVNLVYFSHSFFTWF